MTREDIQELLAMVSGVYPNFKPENKRITVNAWLMLLGGFERECVFEAFKVFCVSDSSGFPPLPGQLIKIIKDMASDSVGELEAWGLVREALRDGNYHAKERFEELPDICKVAVGSAENIREWATKDSSEVETIIMSQFLRSFRIAEKRMQNPVFYKKFNERIESSKVAEIEEKEEAKIVEAPDYLDEIEKKLKKIKNNV